MKRFPFLLFILLLLTATNCKIRYSFTGADVPAEANTLSVDYFPNNASLGGPNLGQTFTEDLRNLFLNQTNLDLVSENGDLQFEGSITGYNVEPIAIQGNETAAMNRLTIRVRVKYTNTIQPDKNFETTFSRFADFESSQNLASVEDELVEEINQQLVQDIFDRSLSNW